MKIQLLSDNILLKPLSETSDLDQIQVAVEGKTAKCGKVLSVGPGRIIDTGMWATTVKEGDTVYYPEFGENKIVLNGESLVLVREADCYGFNR